MLLFKQIILLNTCKYNNNKKEKIELRTASP